MEAKNKKMQMLEETLRFKESEIEKKEALLKRISAQNDDTKKKLMQSEVKMRQLQATTIKDMKGAVRDKSTEVEVLKEMVRAATRQSKAKDIDISRLS